MTTVRCPSCDASVPADAAWCTLCFAELRAQAPALTTPGPVSATPEPAPASPLSPFAAFPATPQPASAPAPQPPAQPATPAVAAPAPQPTAPLATAVAERAVAPTWPCTSCDAQVPLEEMTCPLCGTPFMGGVSPSVSLKVPGVGDLTTMSSGVKFGVIAGGAFLFALLLVLVALVLGHIF